MRRFGQDRQGWSASKEDRAPTFRRGEEAERRIPIWASTSRSWRGEGGQNSGPNRRTEQVEDEETTGHMLYMLPRSELDSSDNDPEILPRITDCQFVASYNWIDNKQPTIMIPGWSNYPTQACLFWTRNFQLTWYYQEVLRLGMNH